MISRDLRRRLTETDWGRAADRAGLRRSLVRRFVCGQGTLRIASAQRLYQALGLEIDLTARVRAALKSRSLQTVSRLTRIPRPTLWRLRNGKTGCTLATLDALETGLRVGLLQ